MQAGGGGAFAREVSRGSHWATRLRLTPALQGPVQVSIGLTRELEYRLDDRRSLPLSPAAKVARRATRNRFACLLSRTLVPLL